MIRSGFGTIVYNPRQGMREMDTLNQMQSVAAGMVARRLMYSDLIA